MASNINQNQMPNFKYWKDQKPPAPGTLFTDPLFPPNRNSLLALDSNGKPIDPIAYKDHQDFVKQTDNYTFARPNEIFGSDYKLFSGKIEVNDIIQGALGDCYFLTALANLTKFPGIIFKKIFRTQQISKNGYYELVLRIDGIPRIVIIDDYIPVYKTNKKPCFAFPHGNELWVMLLEKAWAKINGGYLNIIAGKVAEPFEVLTGFSSRIYSIKPNMSDQEQKEILDEIKNAFQTNCFISCSSKADKEILKLGLVDNHAYSILDIKNVETIYRTNYTLLRLRNPWSRTEWTGDWSDNSNYWDENNKKQVNYEKRNDGIFYMSYVDFFKYFTEVQICYMLYDSSSIRYTVEGEENLKNGSVFNLEIENDGLLMVSVRRKSWRINRELRYKALPTHISIVKINKNPGHKYKIFSDYDGTTKSFDTCTLNKNVTKGNYLIYIYRDSDHAEFTVEPSMDIRIVCSANYKPAQMNFDLREDGFPLLQNIIFQSVLEENKYDFNSSGEYWKFDKSFKNNGLGYNIFYGTLPDTFYSFNGNNNNIINMFGMYPYITKKGTEIKGVIPTGKFFVLLALRIYDYNYTLYDPSLKITRVNNQNKLDYKDVDIDLNLYTDINNDIKNVTFKKRKTQSLENVNININFDINYYDLSTLEKKYSNYFQLLKEIPNSNNNNLKWGIINVTNGANESYLYIGQILNEKKEGKGIYIDSNYVFVGQYNNNIKNGVGITYDKKLVKLNKFNYINGIPENKGIRYYTNGTYQGDFINNKREGKGIYLYNDGAKYEGDYKDDFKNGKGIYSYKDGSKYEGDWVKGLIEGKGILYYSNKDKYVGEFKNDLKEGRGIFYFNNGSKYEGDWIKGKIEGKGILYYVNGDRYEGDFKNDLREGQGVYYFKDGSRQMGNYSNDKPIGIHAKLDINGNVTSVKYNN